MAGNLFVLIKKACLFVFLFLFLTIGNLKGQEFNRQNLLSLQYKNLTQLNDRGINQLHVGAIDRNNLLLNSKLDESPVNNQPDLNLFGNFGNNILDSFKGKNIYLHLAGIASTILIVNTNTDYHVEKFFNEHEEYGQFARPVLVTGTLLPFVVGGGLYAYSKIDNNKEVMGASFAVLQASLIQFLFNSTLKAITGRPHPDWVSTPDMESLSKTFRFGFFRGGVFWGWPSGHTSTTMAVVSALTNYYPDKAWLKVAGYGLVAYTIFGVSSVNRGGMHWFSDAIAAAFMSYAIGSTVGKYYRNIYSGKNDMSEAPAALNTTPSINPLGINLSFQF